MRWHLVVLIHWEYLEALEDTINAWDQDFDWLFSRFRPRSHVFLLALSLFAVVVCGGGMRKFHCFRGCIAKNFLVQPTRLASFLGLLVHVSNVTFKKPWLVAYWGSGEIAVIQNSPTLELFNILNWQVLPFGFQYVSSVGRPVSYLGGHLSKGILRTASSSAASVALRLWMIHLLSTKPCSFNMPIGC